jgi:uncharacterized membrane protein (DUF2068 family)
LTIKEGGSVLFTEQGRVAAGHYVPFVVWFNFLAGFVYVIAGVGLWLQRAWAVYVAFAIAIATLAVYAAFGVYILLGNAYESRTVVAMALRSGIWLVVALLGYRAIVAPTRRK